MTQGGHPEDFDEKDTCLLEQAVEKLVLVRSAGRRNPRGDHLAARFRDQHPRPAGIPCLETLRTRIDGAAIVTQGAAHEAVTPVTDPPPTESLHLSGRCSWAKRVGVM